MVKRSPEFPFVPCVISNLLLGIIVPIPTFPSTNNPLAGAVSPESIPSGVKFFPITTPPFTSNLLAGMTLFPKPMPVFPFLLIKILWNPAPSAMITVLLVSFPAKSGVDGTFFTAILFPKKTL